MSYPKFRHKNNAAVRAEAAERKRRSRENKKLENDAASEKSNLACAKIWAENLAALPEIKRGGLLKLQDQAITVLKDVFMVNEILKSGDACFFVDVTFEDGQRLINERGFEQHRLNLAEIVSLHAVKDDATLPPLPLGSDKILLPDGQFIFAKNKMVPVGQFLLWSNPEYSFFGVRTRMNYQIWLEFLYRASDYFKNRPDEHVDQSLASSCIAEYEKSKAEIARLARTEMPGFEDYRPEPEPQPAKSFSDLLAASKPSDTPDIPAATATNQIKDISGFEANQNFMRRELERLIGAKR